ncbi:FtsQ-type POTRA domain-containing protein [Deinococcus sp. Arct2-2]|uniref:cell division protein FtsQ/DivIB n=1 Tax=Deinococcus sp. Arct2-2 TaxID=2568653 RepID=UPI0010A386A9|nr:FtsQ-type POTRA domain-containing protein [Deinococcus sp. Arct2-2]THF68574.1 FtsQ-type POTRA domain-containing protein [Deinococcus sp. Arct2-2]
MSARKVGEGNRRITPPLAEPVGADAVVAPVVPVEPEPEPTPVFPTPKPRRTRLWTALGITLAAAALAGAWFGLPVRTVTVTGNSQLSAARVQELAGLSPNFGWLYYGAWRARTLARHPWILSASIVKQFPDGVSVNVVERVPYARWQRPDGSIVTLAADGTVLPGAAPNGKLPLLGGWGPDRLADALYVSQLLSRYTVQSVAYTPSGVTVKTGLGAVWSGDLKSLVKYAGSISMYPNKKINIYPWGVSVQE